MARPDSAQPQLPGPGQDFTDQWVSQVTDTMSSGSFMTMCNHSYKSFSRPLTPPPPGPPPCHTQGRICMMTGMMDPGQTRACQVSHQKASLYVRQNIIIILIPGGDTRGYSDDEEEEEDGEYMDQETVEQFEDRVLNKRAAKVCRRENLHVSVSLNKIFFQLHFRMRKMYEDTSSLTYNDLAKRKDTKKDAAQKFYSLLVLQKVIFCL